MFRPCGVRHSTSLRRPWLMSTRSRRERKLMPRRVLSRLAALAHSGADVADRDVADADAVEHDGRDGGCAVGGR